MGRNTIKKNILYILPGPILKPDSIEFYDRFNMLSDNFEGSILSWTQKKDVSGRTIGNFKLSCLYLDQSSASRIRQAFYSIRAGLKFGKQKKVDCIVCYDPVYTGLIGVVLKIFLGSKLVVEQNASNVREAILAEQDSSFKVNAKISLSLFLRKIVLSFSDGIKLLTENQLQNLEDHYKKKSIFAFPSFVATHVLADAVKTVEPYILLIGYPFNRKGVDILIQAFDKFKDQHPEFRLVLVGHRLEEEARKRLGSWDSRVQFVKPVFFKELVPYISNCYCFVLPSREEGMGRALLEAMAAGKAVIGSKVGGIPGLIQHGENGLLFESGDVQGLYDCLIQLASSPEESQKMGENGAKLVENKFSSQRYISNFTAMIDKVLDKK